MNYGERISGYPLIIDENSGITEIEKIPFTKKDFDEHWIQELLRKYPDILPVTDIEPIFDPLLPIGREVPTSSGAIDNMFINPDGYLTIVETKLWRNPEARREVVGQIIDYAKEVCEWSFEELDSRVKEYNNKYNNEEIGVIETIHAYDSNIDEKDLIDSINKNMNRGRFLLIIAGDGIRESVEEMAEFLNQTPNMLFTLALVELQMYKLKDRGDYLVIPQVVTRTREITRAVVKVEGTSIDRVEVDIDTSEDKPGKKKRRKLEEEEFYEKLSEYVDEEHVDFTRKVLEDMQGLGCFIQWRQVSAMVRLKDPSGSKQKLTLFGVRIYGDIFTGWLGGQLENINMNPEIAYTYVANLASLFGYEVDKNSEELKDNIKIDELKDNYEAFYNYVHDTITKINEAVVK